ncbi:MAG: hypothetical protein HN704_10055 [Bacteroidetes bacterium]|nr:hypothetical protein [Bacteroidota bacterium]MBT6685796.1 hypothetical protein [Bacteroidota bacterium]MBT7143708.1 hypothetical protein [Bacteroidota bacterium]MBT7491935.1 hypothetical protein [Bacteroidota bacterium]
MTKIIENRLIEEFKNKEYFTREELFDFYCYFEPELKKGTFGWRIYDLKKRNIIKPIKRGLYMISYKPRYKPGISPNTFKVAKQLVERFNEVKHCVWETSWLNEFTQHQTSRSILIIEIEKGFEESLFYELKDSLKNEIYLNPDEKAIDFYIAESNKPVIVKKLLTRAPLTKTSEKKIKFYTPSLEKILVDLFAEEKLYYYVQGSELIHIYENAITNYTINFTKLFSYAKRREREQDIKQFITNHMVHLVKDIIDD